MEGRDVHEQWRTLSAGGNAKTDGPEKHVIMRVPRNYTGKMSDQKSANKCTAVEEQMKGDDINDLADAFIKNFRNQLRIQREESFKRFQDMLARGT
ncbi:hypothetical protein QQ045_031791 [Rhodiola kirilowii]